LYNVIMYVREALRYKPVALYMLEDTAPYQEESGYNRVGTVVGSTPGRYEGLVSGCTSAPVFLASINGSFEIPVYKVGTEGSAFTIGLWGRYATTTTALQQLLGNSTQIDGLRLNGSVLSFAIQYSGAPEAVVSYDLQRHRVFNVFGVYTSEKISLYVNGELVDEVSLTEEQQVASFLGSTANMTTGPTLSGSQSVAVNGVTAYAKALDGEQIKRLYQVGINVPTAEDVVSSWGGMRFQGTLDFAKTYVDKTWNTDYDWYEGSLNDVVVERDYLYPQVDGDTSIPGTWLDSVPLDGSIGTSIYGVTIDWDGTGAVVEASLNGTTWETAVRGRLLANATNLTTADQLLQIRVTFPGGIVDDESELKSLRVVAIESNQLRQQNGRVITLNGAAPQTDYPRHALDENWGVRMASTGSLVIGPDADGEPETFKTIELYVNRLDSTADLSISAGGGITSPTWYERGASGDGVLTVRRWTLVHLVSTTNITGSVTITGPLQIGHVAFYTNALSAAEVEDIHDTFVGKNILFVNDTSVIALPESDTGHKVYAADWSISASG
jgi:hypothetical protein